MAAPALPLSEVVHRFGRVAGRFLWLMPALFVAVLCLRGWGLWAGVPTGGLPGAPTARLVALASGIDLLVFAKYLPVLFLLSWPCLLIERVWLRLLAVGAVWSLLLLLQVALEQFYLAARVPLGAELFGYSWQEVRTTVTAGARVDALMLAGWTLPLAVLWAGLLWLSRRAEHSHSPRLATSVLVLSLLGLWWLPSRPASGHFASEAANDLALNKAAFFVEENAGYLAASRRKSDAPLPVSSSARATAVASPADDDADPRYPFLHRERTPDTLGDYFTSTAGRPPNFVFIVVEGLGRSFSGPRAAQGSFTPFLDELAGRSLYWDNFLAAQGRTFGVMPSMFASLPFGERGFAALGERMPAHDGLLAVLGRQGYRLSFYSGTNADFDNERLYLQRQGVRAIVDADDFGPQYPRSPGANSWGYADGELVARALADADQRGEPFVTVLQTISMHTPYTVPRQAEYRARFERRLDELGINDADKPRYRQFADIYGSVLYTDDALRRYFEAFARDPAYANTVFVITGDHRLPELPIANRIERYHVPLLIFSPLLKQPQRIRAVSSHLDIAPSLLAFLAHHYGLRTPAAVTWTGTGLDMAPTFRNVHDIALKQSKTVLSEFVSGPWLLSRGELFALGDGMSVEPVADAQVAAQLEQRFARFRAANDRFAQDTVLAPAASPQSWLAYDALPRAQPSAPPSADRSFGVREVRVPDTAAAGAINVDVRFGNGSAAGSGSFVPLVVLTTEDGREVGESYGIVTRLAAGASCEVRIVVEAAGLAPGRYYLAAIASHPVTGQRVGASRYRIPLQIRG